MRKLIILLLLLTGFAALSQTNGNFNNLDVRNRATHRGYTYMYDSVFFKPLSANIPYKSLADSVGWVLSTSNGSEAQLVRVSLQTLADSLLPILGGSYWYLSGDTIIQIDEDKVYLTDSIYIDRYAIPEIQPGDPVSGQVLVMRKLSPNPIGQLARVPIDMLIDSLQYFGINYWTFVDSATDTLKNNVATGDGPGVVAIDGNLELQTTKADGTEGIVKQNGVNILHTYTDNAAQDNLFIGEDAGNYTTTGNYLVGVGNNAFNDVTSGNYSVSVGYAALGKMTTGYDNVALGPRALENLTDGRYNIAVGCNALANITTVYHNVAIGDQAMLSTTNGEQNVAIGSSALYLNKEGQYNTAIGYSALANNGDNDGSTAVGHGAMYYADSRTTGERVTYNTAVGYEAMRGSAVAANNTGQYNTATGYQALDAMTTASFNTIYGYNAGGGITTGDSNILIGTSAGAALTTQSDLLYIDNTNTSTPLVWGNMRSDSLRFNGNVAFVHDIWYEDTLWRDATVSAMALAPGAQAPSLRTFKGGIRGYAYNYQAANDEQSGQVQINHDYKLGCDISPHIHYALETAPGAGDTAVFALEYAWADINEAFPATTIDTILIPLDGKSALTHYLASFDDITGPGGDNISSSIVFAIRRLQSSTHDTYDSADNWVFLLDIDFHIPIDSPGSRTEYNK